MKLRILQPLDFAAGGLALALIIIISVVILVGTWEGVEVNIITSDDQWRDRPANVHPAKILRASQSRHCSITILN